MATLSDVVKALATAIGQALNDQGVAQPAQVFAGWPTAPDLSNILGQGGQYLVAIAPLKAQRSTRYLGGNAFGYAPTVNLIATVSANEITFAGTASAGLNVHTIVGTDDVLYQTVAADTPDTVAAAVQQALVAKGYTATVSGATVSITGAFFEHCNIGGTGTLTQEVGRLKRLVQVAVFASDPGTRETASSAIALNVGSTQTPFLRGAQGDGICVRLVDESWLEPAQMSYTCYQSQLCFEVEYSIEQVSAATQIGAAKSTVNNILAITGG